MKTPGGWKRWAVGCIRSRLATRSSVTPCAPAGCVLAPVGGLCSTRTIAIDQSAAARTLAHELGAHQVLEGGPHVVAAVRDLTHGGAHAVIDFVGELGAEQLCWQMLRQGGTHFIVGYGGTIEV